MPLLANLAAISATATIATNPLGQIVSEQEREACAALQR